MDIYYQGPHHFRLADIVVRLSDGRPARVVEESALYAVVETEEAFPERIEVEQGDPAWFVDVKRHQRTAADLVRTGDFDPCEDDEDEEEEWEGSRVA